MPTTTTSLDQLDLALTHLRRMWESPAIRQRLFDLMGSDVEPSLIRTLRAIERTEMAEPGVRDVARILGVDESTASRLVDQAVTAQTVERTSSTTDRRRSVLTLTEAGNELLRTALVARTTLLGDATQSWDPEDIATLADLLERFSAAVMKADSTP